MASLVPTIKDKEFQNWLRGALALLFTKQGLHDFVKDEITQFQTHLLIHIFRNNSIPFGTVCNTCTTENVLPCPTQNFCPNGRRCNLHDPAQPDKSPNRVCRNNICRDIRDAIRREHRYNGPSWKNTNASNWCTNGFEIAKCYMPPDGYSAVTTFADTDFNGILAVIINNKRFQNKMAAQLHQQNNVCIEAREVGRAIRHSADLSMTDTDLAKHIDTLINLLSDPKYLVVNQKAKEAVDKLKQLKSNQLSITTSDIILVLDNALKDIVTKQRDNALQAILVEKDEANRIIEEKTNASIKLLGNVKDSVAHAQTLTVSLNQIATAKLSALGDIMNVSKKEKQVFAATGTKERQLVRKEIKSISANEQQKLASAGTRERQLVIDEIKCISANEQQELAATGTKERQLVSEEIKGISANEQQELASAGTRERQLVSKEIKSISDKEQQELAATGTRERQLVSEKIKIISAKEQQELAATGTRERQLVSEEIKIISAKEQQELAATGTRERQLVSEKIKSISAKEQQELAATGTRERQLVSEEIKIISAKEQQELAATGTRERQLVSEKIKSISAKEQQELAATGTKERQMVSEEIKSISAKEQQELAATGTREKQLVSEEIKSFSAKEQQELAATGTRERQLVSEKIKSISAKEQQELAATGTRERQLVSEEIRNLSHNKKKDLAATWTKDKQLANEEIKQLSEKEKKELIAVASKERELISEECRKGNDFHNQQVEVSNTSRTQEQLETCLRQDLITFYRDHHSTIPIASLVKEHDVPLVDFYVQPPLTATDTISGRLEVDPTKLPVHSYRNLLLREDGDFYKHIYITAKAGIGKTSFSKRICLTWCQAHIPLQKLEQKFEPDDLEVMEQFEYMFFIPLRDTNTSECDVDNMIYKQVISNLTGSHLYTEYFVKDMLRDRSCLVVLDGLDEWTHPENCRRHRNVHELPHTRVRQRCSVITTTRPWKLDVAQVSLNKIDRLVEINELNKSSSRRLISNAAFLLNKTRLPNQAKSVEEFQQITSSKNLDAIKYIPYILLQMICLWFDGKSVGKSKCEIYSNILELTFARSLIKTGDSSLYPRPKQQAVLTASIPLCLSCNELCTIHFDVVLTIAKLAFETLFTLSKESSLVFSKAEVLHSISGKMVALLLKTGLISQNKDYGCVASRHSKCSFQHKSVQEYFAALYIYSKHDTEPVQQRIGQVCNTLATVLEMSNVFVFLSGFSSEACGKILQMLHKTVSTDTAIKYYRSKFALIEYMRSEERRFDEAVTSFQSMQTDIVQEIIQNERIDFPSHTEDIIIRYVQHKDSFHVLKPLIENSKAYIKSLRIDMCSCARECSEVLDTFGLQNVKGLRMLNICAIPRQQDLQRLLSGSVHSLECLQIKLYIYRNNVYYRETTNISPEIVRLICNMDHLLALSLGGARLTCPDVEVLFKFLSKRTVMTEIALVSIYCRSGVECSGHCLDLSKHQNLNRLEMHVTTGKSVKCVSKLSVNTSSLEACYIGRLLNGVYSPLFQSLLHATSLRILSVTHRSDALTLPQEILPNLINLKQLQIFKADLGDSTFTVPSVMKTLEYIIFHKVKMTSSALRNCIDSANVLPQSVTIRLRMCTVDSEQEYQQLKDDLRSSQKCKIIVDSRKQNVIDFQTVGYGTYK